jgi:hypothetical protein
MLTTMFSVRVTEPRIEIWTITKLPNHYTLQVIRLESALVDSLVTTRNCLGSELYMRHWRVSKIFMLCKFL